MRAGFSVSCGDFDRDGWADLHVTENRLVGMGGPDGWGHNRLLRNRGGSAPAVFEDVAKFATGIWVGYLAYHQLPAAKDGRPSRRVRCGSSIV